MNEKHGHMWVVVAYGFWDLSWLQFCCCKPDVAWRKRRKNPAHLWFWRVPVLLTFGEEMEDLISLFCHTNIFWGQHLEAAPAQTPPVAAFILNFFPDCGLPSIWIPAITCKILQRLLELIPSRSCLLASLVIKGCQYFRDLWRVTPCLPSP